MVCSFGVPAAFLPPAALMGFVLQRGMFSGKRDRSDLLHPPISKSPPNHLLGGTADLLGGGQTPSILVTFTP